MERKYCLMAMLLVAAWFAGLSGFAQTKVYEFDYDASGNRVERQLITLKSASLASSLGENPEQEVFEGILDEREIKIYPNPTKSLLRVEIPLHGQEQQVFLRAYNMQGALIADQVVTDETSRVDLSNRPPGMYILRISSGQSVSEWKIVKE